ncbi:hypothetical protein AURDEDRAFT_115723 [Auricularia subglabra TFB-10046 SS5]|uniref:Uncharacterized protein n=1 Tax=Auricularia subglabra (strain TFB-10046 / SS5) TaxID=717982 RepID=J0DCV4_AURST|nr:hypothetical protein AURDEDRAFT_115723 [Auricularia subglabra TFB-10046 SS5]
MVQFLRETLAEMELTFVDHHPDAPPMPPNNTNSSIPCLPFTPRSERYLKTILPILQEDFEAKINKYLHSLPRIPIDRRDSRRFLLPEPGIGAWIPHLFMDNHVRKYAEDTLATVHNIVSFVDRNLMVHSFGDEKSGGPMLCGWSNFNWGPALVAQHRLAEVKLVTVTMPMWCFAPKDMADFVNMRNFDNPATLSRESAVPTAVKLWARLQDFCYLHDAHYFIVSTYEQWVFGTFSPQYSTAYVSQPMQYDAKSPNVIEAIMCWIHSAYGHSEGFPITKVYSEDNSKPLDAPTAGRKMKRKADADNDAAGATRVWRTTTKPPSSKRRMFTKVPWLESNDRPTMGPYRDQEPADTSRPQGPGFVADNMHFSYITGIHRSAFQHQHQHQQPIPAAQMGAGPSTPLPDNSHIVNVQVPTVAPQPMQPHAGPSNLMSQHYAHLNGIATPLQGPPQAGPSNLAAHHYADATPRAQHLSLPGVDGAAGPFDFQFTPDFSMFLKDASLAYNPHNNGTIDPALIQTAPGPVLQTDEHSDVQWQQLFNGFTVGGESNPILPDLPHSIPTPTSISA